MESRSKGSRLALRLAISGLCVLFAAAGCPSVPKGQYMPTSGVELREMSLDTIKTNIMLNASKFGSLAADCDVVIRSALFGQEQGREQQVVLRGRIRLVKPKKVHLVLYSEGEQLAIELVGDGENYIVQTPIFPNSAPYGGKYGDPLTMQSNRIHFLPEDLADALDLSDLFSGKAQVLRVYPDGWDIFEGGFDGTPITQFPAWHIDSIISIETPKPAVRVLNSVTIDRRTEQLVRLDKFRSDGSLRTRIWYSNPRPVPVADGVIVQVPGELLIWYPTPLEHTRIRIRFDRIKLNVEVPEKEFVLSK